MTRAIQQAREQLALKAKKNSPPSSASSGAMAGPSSTTTPSTASGTPSARPSISEIVARVKAMRVTSGVVGTREQQGGQQANPDPPTNRALLPAFVPLLQIHFLFWWVLLGPCTACSLVDLSPLTVLGIGID